jgi:hypothetical protein
MRQSRNATILRTIPVLVALCLFPLLSQAKYSGGTGEPNNPYQIATAADLIALGNEPNDYNKHFILTADINLDPNLPGNRVFDRAVIAPDTNDVASRFEGTPFTGVLDGQGHAIMGMVVDSNAPYAGLFGAIGDRGCVCNVHMVGGSVQGHAVFPKMDDGSILTVGGTGGLAGINYGLIMTCWKTGPVNGNCSVGGLVGWNFGGRIMACWSTSSIRGVRYVGGLVGHSSDGVILACYSTGPVSGDDTVGGLVGEHFFGTISSCYSTGSVRGTTCVGGLVGCNGRATIAQCYSAGSVDGNDSIGGLVGCDYSGATSACFWDVGTSGQARGLPGTTGLTTSRMKVMQTFRDAGWDFLGERANGLSEYWQMPPHGGYPVLSVFNDHLPHSFQGKGTSDAPYLIETAEDLGAVWHQPMASYQLTADVNLSGIKWGMAVIPAFWGSLDGHGHRITGMAIAGGGYLGLIGQLFPGGFIKDLHLEGVNNVGSNEQIGALIGYNLCGTVSACQTTGSVVGNQCIGGLTGTCYYGVISDCLSSASVCATRRLSGGLVGFSYYGTITSCFTTGSVSGGEDVGGLIGNNALGLISACCSTAAVAGTSSSAGGLTGSNGGTISACCSTGPVDGVYSVGGLSGANVGGTISACYSTGSVSGMYYAGGLVGSNYSATISMCYSTGLVRASDCTGGLTGASDSATGSACFWDTRTSGQIQSDGGTGKTTAEMWRAKTFLNAGWDFVGETANGTADVWWIDEGKDYPRLWWEGRD